MNVPGAGTKSPGSSRQRASPRSISDQSVMPASISAWVQFALALRYSSSLVQACFQAERIERKSENSRLISSSVARLASGASSVALTGADGAASCWLAAGIRSVMVFMVTLPASRWRCRRNQSQPASRQPGHPGCAAG